jgi:hypothetical protein
MEPAAMKRIDEQRLEQDTLYRVSYVSEFMGFDADDITAIRASASRLAPLVPVLVDAVYEKLFSYDATKRHFVPRQSGYEGPLPESLEGLNLDHAMIEFRKAHLARYLVALVSREYDDKMITYLDMVGKMHTPSAGSADLDVPLVQMNALLGFVADALTNVLFSLEFDRATEVRTVRAFQKLLWLQSDLISRHYQQSRQGQTAAAKP